MSHPCVLRHASRGSRINRKRILPQREAINRPKCGMERQARDEIFSSVVLSASAAGAATCKMGIKRRRRTEKGNQCNELYHTHANTQSVGTSLYIETFFKETRNSPGKVVF